MLFKHTKNPEVKNNGSKEKGQEESSKEKGQKKDSQEKGQEENSKEEKEKIRLFFYLPNLFLGSFYFFIKI